jgi:hypothetical protein
MLIDSNDNSGDGNNCKIELNCEAGQSYFIKIKNNNGAIGRYNLTMARGKELNVIKYTQQPYNWLCWASSYSMIVSYFNNDSVERTIQIGQSQFNSTLASSFNKGLERSERGVTQRILQTYTTGVSFEEHTEYVLYDDESEFFGDVNAPNEQISYEEIKAYIDNSYPICVGLSGDVSLPGGTHAVVVKGYTEQGGIRYVIINDPWNGQEYMMNFKNFKTTDYVTFYTGTNPPVIPPAEPIPDEPNNTFETATTLSAQNPAHSAHIDVGDVDYYRFSAPAYCKYINVRKN